MNLLKLVPAIVGGMLLAAGCASYQPKPVDLASHLQDWGRSDADSDRVQERLTRAGLAADSSDGLDLGEAINVALVLNPTARIARLRAAALAMASGFAGAWSSPSLDTEVRHALDGDDSPWIASIGIAFTIPLSGRLAALKAGATAAVDEAQLAAITVENELTRELTVRWLRWSSLVERTRVLTGYRDALKPLVERARALTAAGELSPERLGLLDLQIATAGTRIADALAGATLARREVLGLMGLTPAATVSLVAMSTVPTADWRTQVDPAADWPMNTPAVRLALAGYAVREQDVRYEVARQYPDIVLGPALEFDRGASSLGLGFGITSFSQNRRGIAEARGRREIGRMQAFDVGQRLVSRRARLLVELGQATERLERLAVFGRNVDTQLNRVIQLAATGEIDVLVAREVLKAGLDNRLEISRTRLAGALAGATLQTLLTTLPDPPKTNDGGDR